MDLLGGVKKIILIFILLAVQNSSYAEVTFVGKKDSASKKPIINMKEKSPHKIKRKKVEQYHIEGYAGTKYVRFNVEIINDKIVTGRMIGSDGSDKYVNGELFEGVLHLYDVKGEHFTIVFSK